MPRVQPSHGRAKPRVRGTMRRTFGLCVRLFLSSPRTSLQVNSGAYPVGRVRCHWHGRGVSAPQSAVAQAVAKVNHQPHGHPDDEPLPGHPGQLTHQVAASENRSQWNPRHPGRAERTDPTRLFPAQDEDPHGHQDKCKQGADVGQLNHFVNVGDSRENRDQDAGEDGRDVGRLVARVHALGPRR